MPDTKYKPTIDEVLDDIQLMFDIKDRINSIEGFLDKLVVFPLDEEEYDDLKIDLENLKMMFYKAELDFGYGENVEYILDEIIDTIIGFEELDDSEY